MAAPTVLHITGCGRSGSTLLAFLLNANPQMVSVGEVMGPKPRVVDDVVEPPETYACSCGETIVRCPFWNAVAEHMARHGVDFSAQHWDMTFELGRSGVWRHLRSRSLRNNLLDDVRDALVGAVPAWRARLLELGRRNAALIDAALSHTGVPVFVDASKDPMRVRYLQKYAGADVHVLHLVRDAPGFVSSVLRTNWDTLDGAIGTWMRNAGHCQRLERRLGPGRFMRVLYEDLCRDPVGELTRVAEWVGVAPMEGPIRFREVEHHIIGAMMRLESSGEVRLDESWRERLTQEQVDHVMRETGAVRRALGYA
jgi:hypothetical protein